jgi:hypothetical protein
VCDIAIWRDRVLSVFTSGFCCLKFGTWWDGNTNRHTTLVLNVFFLLFSLQTYSQVVIILSDNAHCPSFRSFCMTVDSVALAAFTFSSVGIFEF